MSDTPEAFGAEQAHRPFNPALGYERYDALVHNIERAVRDAAPRVAGYSPELVSRRILQRIVEVGLNPFIQDCAARNDQGLPIEPTRGGWFEPDGLRLPASPGRPGILVWTWFRSLIEFSKQWIRVLYIVTRASLSSATSPNSPAAILFGIGAGDIASEGSDRQFLEFCRRGPVTPLRSAARILVESTAKVASTEPDYANYAKYPLFALTHEFPARGRAYLRFIREHCGAAIGFLIASITFPVACLLARDIAFHALIAHLDRIRAISSVIITNSHYHVQPLWMRGLPHRQFTSHMVWYSQNSIPFAYRADGIRSYLPNHRHIEVDDIWVWSPGFAEYLRARGARGNVHVVGPILWYLPESGVVPRACKSILVLDVTPLSADFTYRFGLTYNYYRSENVRRFMEDLIEVTEEIRDALGTALPIVLKHKRSHSPFHDASYIDYIDRLGRTGIIELVAPDTNLYSLVSQAVVVVVIPYSSPAYVAAREGVPAIYYDPSQEIVPAFESDELVSFAAGKRALRETLIALLSDRASAH